MPSSRADSLPPVPSGGLRVNCEGVSQSGALRAGIYLTIRGHMSAVKMGSLNEVLNAHGILNSVLGSGQVILLALASFGFSISISRELSVGLRRSG